MPPKLKSSRSVPQYAYFVLPFFVVWTGANVYFGLGHKYGQGGPMLGPRVTKFAIDEKQKDAQEAAPAPAAPAAKR